MTEKLKPKIQLCNPEIDLPRKFHNYTLMIITPQNETKGYLCAFNNNEKSLYFLLNQGPQYTPIKIPDGQVSSINKSNLEFILERLKNTTQTLPNNIPQNYAYLGTDPTVGSYDF